jgi:hypothetical protein
MIQDLAGSRQLSPSIILSRPGRSKMRARTQVNGKNSYNPKLFIDKPYNIKHSFKFRMGPSLLKLELKNYS